MLRWAEPYEREKRVYERLRREGVVGILGFNVPQLLGFDDGLRVIEMTSVKRPFVLDFAGAYLDARPEFPEEIWTDWEAEKESNLRRAGQRFKESWTRSRNSVFI